MSFEPPSLPLFLMCLRMGRACARVIQVCCCQVFLSLISESESVQLLSVSRISTLTSTVTSCESSMRKGMVGWAACWIPPLHMSFQRMWFALMALEILRDEMSWSSLGIRSAIPDEVL